MKKQLLLILLLSACTTFPQVDAAESELAAGGAPPALLPTDQLGPGAPMSAAQSAGAALTARAARLRLRGQQAMNATE